MEGDTSLSYDSQISIDLTDEELAAVEGWRKANRYASIEQASRELLRLGLLSEIARTYRGASDDGAPEN